jgi:hypothetical protein
MIFYPTRIPNPGIKKATNLGSGSAQLLRTVCSLSPIPVLKLVSVDRNTQRTLNNIPGSLECLVNLGDVDLSQNQLTKVMLLILFFLLSFCRLECVGHSFAYVAYFCIFERCLDSNPESYQPSHPSP